MPEFWLSGAARKDLKEIANYTLKAWGEKQMWKYTRDITRCCAFLAAGPESGRQCDRLALGLRRFEVGKHVIFYLREPERIIVVRILHQQMLPTSKLF